MLVIAGVPLTVSKLSQLQRFILTSALGNAVKFYRTNADHSRSKVSVETDALFLSDVLINYFKFPVDPNWKGYTGLDPWQRGNNAKFYSADVGKSRYQSGYAATSRAVRRLHDRGLVEYFWAPSVNGITLTTKGRDAAKLLASKVA